MKSRVPLKPNTSDERGHGSSTAAGFISYYGIVQSGDTLYVTDRTNHSIRTVHTTTTRFGTIVPSRPGLGAHSDGPGTSARFNDPRGAAAAADTLYVADQNNHRIRAIDLASGTVRDIAGDGTTGNTNGIGTAARLTRPNGIFVSGDTLYVTSRRLIRKLEYREVGS